jgi:2-dehydro-3-deoxyphosphogalactonate aldolase
MIKNAISVYPKRRTEMSMNRRGFVQSWGLAAAGVGAGARGAAAAGAQDARTPGIKVTGAKTILLDTLQPQRKWLFIQLFTDKGLVGLGERPSPSGVTNLKSQIELLNDLCERFVIGKSPFDIEKIWQSMYTSSHDLRHPSLYAVPAFAAIEMACWDLVGKALNQPVYKLLGGQYHDKLRAYAYLNTQGVWEKPELAGERAVELVKAGNTCCKLDPFTPITGPPKDYPLKTIRHVAKIFRAIRDAVGDELEIAIGTHGQFSTAGAIRVASILEEFNPYWFEEPVSPENVDEMARVAAHTSIPIATGERLVTKFEFAQVLQKQAAQIIQLDVGQCGGILESKKIAGMAEAHYAMIAPHMYCGPVAVAAAVQLDTCSSNFLIQEYNANDLHREIVVEPMKFENGFITPPTGPGLGIELNERVVKRQLSH